MANKKQPNPIDMHVGSRVRMRRMMLGMSQEKLGENLGITFQQIQKYEKGTNRIGASRLQHIATVLEVPVSFFFEDAPGQRRTEAARNGRGEPASYVDRFPVDAPKASSSTRLSCASRTRRFAGVIIDLVARAGGRRRRGLSRRRRLSAALPAVAGEPLRPAIRVCRMLSPAPSRAPCVLDRRRFAARRSSPAGQLSACRTAFEGHPVARPNYLFTSESVSEGHPDKVCDRISDEIVDALSRARACPEARVACETLATTNRVVIAGEVARSRARSTPASDRASVPRAGHPATSATSRTASTGRTPRSRCCCTPSRPISPRASMPAATRTRAPATRASCSAMPAARRRT